MAHDDEKIAPIQTNTQDVGPLLSDIVSTKEHDEVIEALSGRLAMVKETVCNLKQEVSAKDTKLERMQFELTKKQEMIADLIEKLMDKPLPPTPSEMQQMEHGDNGVNGGAVQTHRLSGSDSIMVVKSDVTSGRYRVEYKRPPASMPPPAPKVVVSPAYDKGVVFNSHYPFPVPKNEASTPNNGGTKTTTKTLTLENSDDVDSDEGI